MNFYAHMFGFISYSNEIPFLSNHIMSQFEEKILFV